MNSRLTVLSPGRISRRSDTVPLSGSKYTVFELYVPVAGSASLPRTSCHPATVAGVSPIAVPVLVRTSSTDRSNATSPLGLRAHVASCGPEYSSYFCVVVLYCIHEVKKAATFVRYGYAVFLRKTGSAE